MAIHDLGSGLVRVELGFWRHPDERDALRFRACLLYSDSLDFDRKSASTPLDVPYAGWIIPGKYRITDQNRHDGEGSGFVGDLVVGGKWAYVLPFFTTDGYVLDDSSPNLYRLRRVAQNAVEAELNSPYTGDQVKHTGKFLLEHLVSVFSGGRWLSFSQALGRQNAGRRVPTIKGSLGGAPFVVRGQGHPDGSSRNDIFVAVSDNRAGQLEVELFYGMKADGAVSSWQTAVVVTFVNDWREESAPSPPVLIETNIGKSAKIEARYEGDPDGRPIVGMNVYRTYAHSDAYLLVNETPVPPDPDGVFRYEDVSGEPKTTTALLSAGWDPPREGLTNLVFAGNGFFAASLGKDIYLSEPYRPHAWPYAVTMTHEVVSLCPVEGGVLATTREKPVILYGAHPQQIASQVVGADQAGLSMRATARVAGGAVFASNDGLVQVSGGRADLSGSRALFTREDWRERFGARFLSLVLGEHDGRLVGVLDDDSSDDHGFLMRTDEADATMTRLSFPRRPLGLSVILEDDALVFGFDGGYAEGFIGALLPLDWHSKDFIFPRPVSFGAAVMACRGDFTLRVYAAGKEVYVGQTRGEETAFRLPPVPAQKRWSVRFDGAGSVQKFEMAESFMALQHA